jgi:CBS domain containing-hemolysin-like protein
MITIIIAKIILFLLFLSGMAFFAGSETALTSLSTISLRRLKGAFPARERFIAFWEERPNELLATILVATNVALVGTSVTATSFAVDLSEHFGFSRQLMLTLVPAAVVLITLLFGDLLPKIFSRYKADSVAVAALPVLVGLNAVFEPLNRFLIRISEMVIGIFGRRAKETPFLKPEELRFLLSSEETLPLPTTTRRMLRNILDFGNTKIRKVMIPRSEIQAVDLEQDPQAVIAQIIEKEYSRVPVYRGNLDNIVGIIYSKDLALAWRGGSLFLIDDLIRPVYFVPGSARIDQVLREFKTGHHHLALVVDEFGSTIGLATSEDLVEEIVGEIWDEYDIQEKNILPLPEGGFLVRAGESLAHVNDELKLNLPTKEFATVSGWVLDLFGKIPKIGETVRWDALEIEVADADKKKILRVKIRKIG